MMRLLFYGEVQYPVPDPDTKEQLRIDPVTNLERGTQQGPVKEINNEEPLGTQLETKWTNIKIKQGKEPLLKLLPDINILLYLCDALNVMG